MGAQLNEKLEDKSGSDIWTYEKLQTWIKSLKTTSSSVVFDKYLKPLFEKMNDLFDEYRKNNRKIMTGEETKNLTEKIMEKISRNGNSITRPKSVESIFKDGNKLVCVLTVAEAKDNKKNKNEFLLKRAQTHCS